MLLAFFQSMQDSWVGTSIRESLLVFPVIESVHVLGLALSVGLIFVTDLRLIGWRLMNERVWDVTRQLRPWMLTGLATMFLTGGLLFFAEAARCYQSPAFRLKVAFLILAGLNALYFETITRRAVGVWDGTHTPPRPVRIAGWVSIACWTGVVIFGRWTAYGL
jgi:hypothetical protein